MWCFLPAEKAGLLQRLTGKQEQHSKQGTPNLLHLFGGQGLPIAALQLAQVGLES